MVVLSSIVGKNEDLLPQILSIYGKNCFLIADITYGNGNFWKNVDLTKYEFVPSDIKTNGIDFRNLPYENNWFDLVAFDPPYMHSSPTPIRADLDKTYRNNDKGGWGAEYVYDLYRQGMKEAQRTLKPKGIMLVKCQDQVESGKNYFDHIKIYNIATEELNLLVEDLFILTRTGTPMMRHNHQLHARKNHSYMWVFRKK